MAATQNIPLRFSPTSVSFDAQAFDDALRAHGVKLVHFRAMRCPVGLVDRYDTRRPHEDHSGCSNGFIYTKAGTLTCIFTGNGNDTRQNDVGVLDGSTVQVTSPRMYDDTDEESQVANFDRFYLNEESITVPHWQLVEAHITGRDRLSFPVVKVVDVMDATGRRYNSSEYDVEDGQLVWKNGGPGYDAERERGVIYAIRFTYRPYWYVQRVVHQVRVAQVETLMKRSVQRMPQGFVLQRETVFEKEEKDDQAPDPSSPRQVKGPAAGTFGPR